MDRGWMEMSRIKPQYKQGVIEFLDFAFAHSAKKNKILCPCKKCTNCSSRERDIVYEHLICDGFKHGYKRWIFHGELSNAARCNTTANEGAQVEQVAQDHDEMAEMLRDIGHGYGIGEMGGLDDDVEGVDLGDGADVNDAGVEDFYKLVDDASQELYIGCKKFSKLNFLVRLLHTKFLGGWSDKSFDMLLELLNDAFPDGCNLPKQFHEAKKLVKRIGLGYITIDACENDCVLFWKDSKEKKECPICHTSRWKMERTSLDGRRVNRVPRKVFRYFPIKERLQRLFLNPEKAANMRWHDEHRTKDGLLRHPADSPNWKHIDSEHPQFGDESRNVRLALATDGFNPFRSMNCNHSTWPILLIPYNLPSCMIMKQSNFILAGLTSGPKSPGNDIDVYLEPLIDDLESLWKEGIWTYDSSKRDFFQMKAAVLCIISDLPGLGYAHGCATSGEVGCPDCHSETCSLRLKKGSKTCYMGHRRFLDENHRFRSDKKRFETLEVRAAPSPRTGEDILKETENINVVFGKDPSGKKSANKRKNGDPPILWKKKSIFFRLPYWKDLLVHHNFDVMHIEKNVCDNIFNTLLGIDGKSKDNLNSRLDVKSLNIRGDLHPREEEGELYIPRAPYYLTSEQKKMLCEWLKGVKFPDGYASNISSRVDVNAKKLIGLKSHDNHILLQQLLPLAIRKILPEGVTAALIRLSNFFKRIYSPVVQIKDMQQLEEEIAETLSILETIFPPSFFDSMVHLMVHLPSQVRLVGTVQSRNMYSVERFLMTLKRFVRTRSHPEGSIAEGYIFDESLTFCSQYLHGCETRFNRKARNDYDTNHNNHDELPYFSKNVGKALVGNCNITLDNQAWLQPVAKATLQTTNPEARVGGSLLGLEYNEVVVNSVIKGDHVLPRQHGKLKTLADCIGHSIAWPHLNIVNEERATKQSKAQHLQQAALRDGTLRTNNPGARVEHGR